MVDFLHPRRMTLLAARVLTSLACAARRLAVHLPDARLLEIEGARHELLREHDRHQARFWVAFDEFVRPGAV